MTCRQHRNLPSAHDEGRRTYRENIDLINKTSPYNPDWMAITIKRINPEAPLDGLNDHWETPPKSDGWWSLLVVAFAVVLAGIAVYSCAAHAHMPDRPELDVWFSKQESGFGLCCSFNDSAAVADVDYDTVTSCENNNFGEHVCTSHYRVRLDGKWLLVPDGAIVPGPNLYGAALVWTYQSMSGTTVRCFRPGAGG